MLILKNVIFFIKYLEDMLNVPVSSDLWSWKSEW